VCVTFTHTMCVKVSGEPKVSCNHHAGVDDDIHQA
jgi:hypothetical protein